MPFKKWRPDAGGKTTMSDITMPRLSDTMQEGTIARWLKKVGDKVNKGDILGEIETDKATMDLEAYESGILERILVQEGETVPIGQTIAVLGTGAGTTAAVPAEQPVQVAAQPSVPTAQAAPPTPAVSAPRESVAAGDGAAVKASPLARRMAEEYGINLSQVRGSGPGGRIVRDDIEDFREQRGVAAQAPAAPAPTAPAAPMAPTPPAPAVPPAAPPDTELVKLSRVQMLIARRLTEAKQTIPHFYVSSEVDMTDVLAMRQTLNATAGEDGVKVTVNDLIVKAAALALEKFPEVNSTLKEDHFVRYKHINVGFAVDAPTGLVVPVIRNTNVKGVRAIARESKALIAKARNNKLTPTDLEGGTFSVSNLGMMDASSFIAVINPPQAAILAIAAARKQFVPVDGQPVIRDVMTMTLSADHRILSGATVARFLQEVKQLLQNPYSLLG
jgi:pyruvate dehydrogenase E2 component (dihydrolipoamide acetyltransferase)